MIKMSAYVKTLDIGGMFENFTSGHLYRIVGVHVPD